VEARDQKNARRERTLYHFHGWIFTGLAGRSDAVPRVQAILRVVPIVMLHDQDETRRFEAVFSDEQLVNSH